MLMNLQAQGVELTSTMCDAIQTTVDEQKDQMQLKIVISVAR